eukprot:CAMPEP_0116998546 /NCGR_PEP_ID=MMETSP0472-20121206/1577_1 /TAXON_ID=693140 ORGANISM="Tiarina fusus, Strain LIS" /NCGR_SAMPLE_ID=MMETSP0472 /ASSEMBLY_ACC=CAM_ASM_000603 /LENGTH=556 /DNA_ID=CAMNT_0004697725 /DNA_START=11 /DNA_END=1681 /DNA_ORIENTATION=+
MGICGSKEGTDSESKHTSMHQGILRERKYDVYKKYEEIKVMGQGSMGHVAKVRVREGQEGGSAYSSSHKGGSKISRGADLVKKSSSIGAGETQTVSERRKNRVDYALKSIKLDRVSPQFVDELRNEIDILKGMDHPNIVKAHEVYSYKKQIYIILELCDGGDLYTKLPYTEKQAAKIVGKLLSAVKYMHDHGIVHRDLKFENIMFENNDDAAEIKVIDFGLSKKFVDNKIGVMHEGVGTLYSMSPQVLQGVYTSQADMWSCGVITYMLLSSHRPFYHKRRKVMIDRIMRVEYNFDKDYWDPVSDEAKDMIDKLLVLDPKKRMNAAEALQHKWLSKEFKLTDRMAAQETKTLVEDSLLAYKETSQLKKIALNVIAHKSSAEDILDLRKLFDQYDEGNDGTISFDEFRKALEASNYPEKEVKEIFKSIDVNQNGHIMYTEFIAAALTSQANIEEERIAEAFDRLDSDDSGYISRENLKEFLGKESTWKDVEAIMNEGDKDKDGKISWEDFLELFRSHNAAILDRLERAESAMGDGDSVLVGLDAKIPGGKYDSSVSNR